MAPLQLGFIIAGTRANERVLGNSKKKDPGTFVPGSFGVFQNILI
jgi:hypothetical protein